MTLDTTLLQKARTAEKDLTESERQALLARAEYNTSIRRLHLAGASFREIAAALGISHQRVQQIVEASGGTWWQRVWRGRGTRRDAVCTYCDRPPSEVDKLIAGPNVYICDSCISLAEKAAKGAGRSHDWAIAGSLQRASCSFCRKGRTSQRAVLTSKSGNICAKCLETCREILSAREPA